VGKRVSFMLQAWTLNSSSPPGICVKRECVKDMEHMSFGRRAGD